MHSWNKLVNNFKPHGSLNQHVVEQELEIYLFHQFHKLNCLLRGDSAWSNDITSYTRSPVTNRVLLFMLSRFYSPDLWGHNFGFKENYVNSILNSLRLTRTLPNFYVLLGVTLKRRPLRFPSMEGQETCHERIRVYCCCTRSKLKFSIQWRHRNSIV